MKKLIFALVLMSSATQASTLCHGTTFTGGQTSVILRNNNSVEIHSKLLKTRRVFENVHHQNNLITAPGLTITYASFGYGVFYDVAITAAFGENENAIETMNVSECFESPYLD